MPVVLPNRFFGNMTPFRLRSARPQLIAGRTNKVRPLVGTRAERTRREVLPDVTSIDMIAAGTGIAARSRIMRPKRSIRAGSIRIWGAACSLARSRAACARSRSDVQEPAPILQSAPSSKEREVRKRGARSEMCLCDGNEFKPAASAILFRFTSACRIKTSTSASIK
jgi:hypothetical protein